jgi:BTB/POZ domain
MALELMRDMILENDFHGLEAMIHHVPHCINVVPAWPMHMTLVHLTCKDDSGRAYPDEFGNVLNRYSDLGFTLLHYAAVNLYNYVCKKTVMDTHASCIIDHLLENGADPTIESKPVRHVYSATERDQQADSLLPSMILDRFVTNPFRDSDDFKNDEAVIELFAVFRNNEKIWETKHEDGPTIPESTRAFLSSLRTNPNVDVVTFCCKDGVNVTAHPAILSASSAYFKTYFDGPWAEAHPDGRWETEHTSELMNIMLDYLYTGNVDHDGFMAHCRDLYLVATEFELESIQSIARSYVAISLSGENVKETLSIAYLHGDGALRYICYEYLKARPAAWTMDPTLGALSTENPELWKELRGKLQLQRRKRGYNETM